MDADGIDAAFLYPSLGSVHRRPTDRARRGGTDDIAHAAVFLASDEPSFITGQDLAVDGGLVPFGKLGREESVAFRAEIARRERVHVDPLG